MTIETAIAVAKFEKEKALLEEKQRSSGMNMLEGQILYHQLQAQYWMALATTGLAKRRDVFHGDKTPLSDEDKTKAAMDIANNHIHLVGEMVEKLPAEAKYDYYKRVSA